jgi:hypothetical protein
VLANGCLYLLAAFEKNNSTATFFHLLFRSWESFGVAGEWPNLRLVLRLAYLRVYILNSLPYLELQRNIIAPEGFLENVP